MDHARELGVPRRQSAAPARQQPPTTPEERFAALLAQNPPAAPQPLPARFTPLAQALTGRVPRYRTGHAVRSALGAVGAHAATVAGTLHLPAPPDASPRTLGVVAHELSHVAEAGRHVREHGRLMQPGRPRFFLDRLSGGMDAGERHARLVGSMVRERATRSASSLPTAAGALPVPALPALPGLPGGRGTALPDVTSLPVGGSGAALSAARQALGEPAGVISSLGEHRAAAGDVLGAVPALPTVPAAASSAADAALGQLGDTNSVLPPALASAQSAVGAAGGVSGDLQAAASTATSAVGDPDGRIGMLMEALEERLLAELERRGGRYAGVF